LSRTRPPRPIARRAPSLRFELVRQSDRLKHSKKLDDDRVLFVLQDLELLGLLKREDDLVSLTVEGTRRFQQISDQINEFANQMWDGLGSDELATAARVLTTITQRANEILAA
jgi:hypothetical protein